MKPKLPLPQREAQEWNCMTNEDGLVQQKFVTGPKKPVSIEPHLSSCLEVLASIPKGWAVAFLWQPNRFYRLACWYEGMRIDLRLNARMKAWHAGLIHLAFSCCSQPFTTSNTATGEPLQHSSGVPMFTKPTTPRLGCPLKPRGQSAPWSWGSCPDSCRASDWSNG